ncbi:MULTISPECIES: hypothetical protein [Paraburkholderia]|uniref:hypothetical protein n=1 Tax=Paraburkholderia TaxID=1822464 RepID=UPI001EF754C5|nr:MULTISPECIES: hypothetical protein [Paraburkholderia]
MVLDQSAENRGANACQCARSLRRYANLRGDVITQHARISAGRASHEREARVFKLFQLTGRIDQLCALVVNARVDIARHQRAEYHDSFLAPFR